MILGASEHDQLVLFFRPMSDCHGGGTKQRPRPLNLWLGSEKERGHQPTLVCQKAFKKLPLKDSQQNMGWLDSSEAT